MVSKEHQPRIITVSELIGENKEEIEIFSYFNHLSKCNSNFII